MRESILIAISLLLFSVAERILAEPAYSTPTVTLISQSVLGGDRNGTVSEMVLADRLDFVHACADLIPMEHEPVFLAVTTPVPDWRPDLCAQVVFESSWDPLAASFCCVGLGQFALGTWVEQAARVGCEGMPRTDPECGLKAQLNYMTELMTVNFRSMSEVEPFPMAEAAYNAGPGNIGKERRVCGRTRGCDPERWFGHVELVCEREGTRKRPGACGETFDYVRRIKGLVER